MTIRSELRSDPRTALSRELPIWAGLLTIVLFANLGIVEFSTPILTAFFYVAVGCVVVSKWLAGNPNAKDMRNFVYVGVLFWILLDPLQLSEGIEEFRYSVVAETLLYVAIFLTMVSLGYWLPPSRKLVNAVARITEPPTGTQVVRAAILVYLIGVTPILYYSQGSVGTFAEIFLAGTNWEVDAGWRRGALGTDLDYVFTICFLILNATPFLAIWALNRISLNPLQKVALVWIILSVLLLQFFSGSRRIFAFLVIGLMLYVFNAMPSHKRKIWIPVFALAPFILLLSMQAQVQFRTGGFYDFDLASVETNLFRLHRDNIFYWMLTAVSVMPEQYSFTWESPFLDLIIHPIPRFLWAEKPIGGGFPFLRWDEIGGTTLTISVIGQFYVAQGMLGVVIAGLTFGWVARNWDQLIKTAPDGSIRSLIYYTGGVLFFVVGIRNFGEIVTHWYSVGFLILGAHLLGRHKSARRAGTGDLTTHRHAT